MDQKIILLEKSKDVMKKNDKFQSNQGYIQQL